MFLIANTEHLLVLAVFLFPPVLFTVIFGVILTTVGKSIGIRERYVGFLIRIFEWGAGEIRTTQVLRKQSRMFELGGANDSDEEICESVDGFFPRNDYCFSFGNDLNHLSNNNQSDDIFYSNANGNDSGLHSPLELERSLSLTLSSSRKQNSSTTSLRSVSSTRMRHSSGQSIIVRETAIHLDELDNRNTVVNSRGWQVIQDSVYFIKAGMEAIIEDEVTSRFQTEQLASWNMLTRTSISFYQFVNWKLTILWGIGFLFRYLILFPLRMFLFFVGLICLILTTAVIGIVPNGRLKRWMNEKSMLMCFRIIAGCLSAVIYFHDNENKAKNGGICVANHTSPIDVMVLSTDNIYALVGQQHSGVLGIIQRALSRASSHIWFERGEVRDRAHVARTLKQHVDNPDKLSILIFPEGTCINNTSVMMFKKGSFEVGATIYPIAMKYDSRFGDPFWNSSTQSWARYIMEMMTSWALICHVWYLPPMKRLPNETGIDFANRVKKVIAIRGGLVDLEWDGQLKRSRAPEKLLEKQREKYYQRYTRFTSCSEPEFTKSINADNFIDFDDGIDNHVENEDNQNFETEIEEKNQILSALITSS